MEGFAREVLVELPSAVVVTRSVEVEVIWVRLALGDADEVICRVVTAVVFAKAWSGQLHV